MMDTNTNHELSKEMCKSANSNLLPNSLWRVLGNKIGKTLENN